jgi:hypothetical protein
LSIDFDAVLADRLEFAAPRWSNSILPLIHHVLPIGRTASKDFSETTHQSVSEAFLKMVILVKKSAHLGRGNLFC